MVQKYFPKVLIFCILTFFTVSVSNAQVGINTTTPNGILEVNSSNTGVVLPRLALTRTDVMAPATNPQGGLIPTGTVVYNTNTTDVFDIPNNLNYSVNPGIYVWTTDHWEPQFTLYQAAVYKQEGLDMRTKSNAGWETVVLSGTGNFLAKYTGYYKVEVGVNFGGGNASKPSNSGEVNVAAQTGTFRFTFNGIDYLIPTKAFSAQYRSGSNIYAIWRQDVIILYIPLHRNDNPDYSLAFDQDASPEFVGSGNSGTGLGWVGDDIPCSIEITYIGPVLEL
ncbi:hypothetical protein [Bizionia paragorgiae]|uniref:hypothetical protein n=1 Tax=Bizionia paragorgiae TaxID=283786 RepID=UPI003A8F3635